MTLQLCEITFLHWFILSHHSKYHFQDLQFLSHLCILYYKKRI